MKPACGPALPSSRVAALPLLLALALVAAACGSIAKPKGWAAPELQGDTLYVSLNHGRISAFNVRSPGQQLWEFPEKDERLPLVVENGRNLGSAIDTKIKLEGLYGDPAVRDDAIYVTAYSGHVAALTTSGERRWVAELTGRLVGGVLVTDDTVYAGTTRGDVFALERATGAVRWRSNAGGRINEVWSSPVRAGDLIVVTAMNGKVFAFDRDGSLRWEADVADAAIASTPAQDGDRLYVGSFDRHIYALDARTGDVLWQSARGDNWFWTEILAQGDTLFAGSLGGTVYALDARSGNTKWSTKVGKVVRSRPALVNGVLVVGSKDGRLHGLRPDTGDRVWEVSASPAPDDPAAPRGNLYADLLPTRDGVYVTTERSRGAGHIYFLDLTQQKVREVALR